MAKRFRKVYIVCKDNQIFTDMQHVPIYKYLENAEYACRRFEKEAMEQQQKYWNANRPLPKFRVHGFYLVHEDVFRN